MNIVKTISIILLVIISAVPALLADKYNYTWSLLIFVSPIVAISYVFSISKNNEIVILRRQILTTLYFLMPMGIILNVFFSDDFFVYSNINSTLGFTFSTLDLFSIDYENRMPVEEMLFYLTGFPMMLFIYNWLDHYVLPLHRNVESYPRLTTNRSLISSILFALLLATFVIATVWLLKIILADNDTFPGYFAYLVLVPFVVTIVLLQTVKPIINKSALSFVIGLVLAISIIWEVFLAIPLGWWDYQNESMLGLFIPQWYNIPIEAVLVWLLAPVTSVIIFESIRIRAITE